MIRNPLRLSLAAAAALAAGALQLPAQTVASAVSPAIQYMGRYEVDGQDALLGYPGSMIQIRFTGESLTLSGVVDGQAAFFNASIDGVALPRVDLESGQFAYTFKHFLDPKEPHLLRLVRRNETWHGIVRLDQISVEGGELLEPPALPERKMLCIGDSITCGEKADFFPHVEPGLSTWNAERSYGWMLAKDFNAQVHLVSYGGRGLIRDWQGLAEPATAPVFFERALPDSADSPWNHADYQPDLVTICLGTNDFSQGIPDRDAFVGAYIDFVGRIHEAHPQAKVLLISGPWFAKGDAKRQALNAYINETIAHFEEQGHTFVSHHFFTETYPGTPRDAHPVATQHRAMADDIGRTLSAWLGWRANEPRPRP